VDKYITENFEETQKVGQNFAHEILALGAQKNAVVLALRGDLGAGKTTFLQGLARGLGIEEVVNSPTFVIMKKFKINDLRFKNFYHLDLYRLENEKDMEFLDINEIVENSENIVAIEWPEKAGDILPKNTILIKFQHIKEGVREVIIDKL